MLYGKEALDLVGFPHSHESAFHTVARNEKTIIISRAVGGVCTQLIEEGYDTNGFRIHAKSCNWGPRAGFVCRAPELNKNGSAGAAYNDKAHHEALTDADGAGWKADTVELFITNTRFQYLQREGLLSGSLLNDVFTGRAMRLPKPEDTERFPTVTVDYKLVKGERNGHAGWALMRKNGQGEYAPLLGMRNPYPAYPKDDHRNAVTGDYDLFAIWPRRSDWDPDDEDRRLAGMGGGSQKQWVSTGHGKHERVDRNKQIIGGEDRQMGNITNRVHLVAQMLNSVIGDQQSSPNRNMVHHSDEGGRPFVGDVDLPLIAFTPPGFGTRNTFGIQDLQDMRAFVDMCRKGQYAIVLNRGWVAEIGETGVEQSWDNSWAQHGKTYEWANRNTKN
jgi:hypothetical protein